MTSGSESDHPTVEVYAHAGSRLARIGGVRCADRASRARALPTDHSSASVREIAAALAEACVIVAVSEDASRARAGARARARPRAAERAACRRPVADVDLVAIARLVGTRPVTAAWALFCLITALGVAASSRALRARGADPDEAGRLGSDAADQCAAGAVGGDRATQAFGAGACRTRDARSRGAPGLRAADMSSRAAVFRD